MSTEMDVRVARAMGWTLNEAGYPVNFWMGTDGMATGYCDSPWPEDAERYGDAPMLFSGEGVWSPSTDIAAARAMEDWIAGQGHLVIKYALAMDDVLLTDRNIDQQHGAKRTWALLRATPEQRCRAFLAAMEAR